MIIKNSALAVVQSQLQPELDAFIAAYVPASEAPVVLPETGTIEFAKMNETLSGIKKLVKSAMTITHSQRKGEYTNIELGTKMTDGSEFNREEYEAKRSYFNLYRRYDGYAPVFGKKYKFDRHDTKINNRIANDFFGEIINQKASFVFGTPALYTASDEPTKEVLTVFVQENNMHSLDMDTLL